MTCTSSRHGGDGRTWLSAYTAGCRCPEARKAATRHQKGLRLSTLRGEARLVPANGVILRLRALQGIGYSISELALLLGYASKESFGPLLYGPRRQTVTVQRYQRVKDLYDRLWNTPGTSVRSVNRAAKMGWPLPLDLDDDLIDHPDYRPTDNRLDEVTDRRQQREALNERVAELDTKGLSAREISELTGLSERGVERRRAAARIAA